MHEKITLITHERSFVMPVLRLIAKDLRGLTSISYEDDKMLIAETLQKLQHIVNTLNSASMMYYIKINS